MNRNHYNAIGIRPIFHHRTRNWNAVYHVFIACAGGEIEGPYTVAGHYMTYWGVDPSFRYHDGGRAAWKVYTHFTPSGREVIDRIETVND